MTNEGRPWRERTVGDHFQACWKRVGKWIAVGFSDEVLRKASGHKSLEAFRRYVHLDPPAVMRLVDNRVIQAQTAREVLAVAKQH